MIHSAECFIGPGDGAIGLIGAAGRLALLSAFLRLLETTPADAIRLDRRLSIAIVASVSAALGHLHGAGAWWSFAWVLGVGALTPATCRGAVSVWWATLWAWHPATVAGVAPLMSPGGPSIEPVGLVLGALAGICVRPSRSARSRWWAWGVTGVAWLVWAGASLLGSAP